jgi:hypothetical protein
MTLSTGRRRTIRSLSSLSRSVAGVAADGVGLDVARTLSSSGRRAGRKSGVSRAWRWEMTLPTSGQFSYTLVLKKGEFAHLDGTINIRLATL